MYICIYVYICIYAYNIYVYICIYMYMCICIYRANGPVSTHFTINATDIRHFRRDTLAFHAHGMALPPVFETSPSLRALHENASPRRGFDMAKSECRHFASTKRQFSLSQKDNHFLKRAVLAHFATSHFCVLVTRQHR